jgi:hypothetical protein
MPNGDPIFDYEEMERFFAPIADVIHRFANKRNLLIDKYYHDTRDCSLRFNHPKDGQASIHLRRDHENRLMLSSAWHYDDYEKSMRFLYARDERQCSINPDIVSRELENELQGIVGVSFGAWQRGDDCGWKRFTKEEFQAMLPKYPERTLDH